ncbi:MAG TPA: type II toxin-antitoxin system mRNA interferase toxin, RelE/StbE family [Alcanivorax sp.]|jgi:mRNA interferase RelE/StbE|nr:type II toxin-antitoxin system mRNA interferase toxin, RelE/StbE family [Alcanivorax sp.]|tara:strand:- start:103 stop:363 length:261 start_codon:yes stop_codon:yes gene_type:complete
MASYKLVFKRSVAKDFRPIPRKDAARLLRRIDALREEPRPVGCEKLSGLERYRIRQGRYRVVYEITDECLIVTVVKVARRGHVYRR